MVLEVLILIFWVGWVVKVGIVGGIIKGLGEIIISYYENKDVELFFIFRVFKI